MFYFIIGVLVGLFIPEKIRNFIKSKIKQAFNFIKAKLNNINASENSENNEA